MKRLVASALILCGLACTARDRIALHFVDDTTRAEATRAEVYALAMETRRGDPVDCDALADGRRSVDDDEVVVAQHTSLTIPLPPDADPLLVQLPQERYLFFAEAFDRFGFRVAHGCTVDDVSSARRLERTIALITDPPLTGELSAVGDTSWLQHAGAPGLETARRLEVQALGSAGLLRDVEVRTLVESGEAVVLDSVLRTDDLGRAGSLALIGSGEVRLLVHVRGLSGSPLRFVLQGVPSPTFQTTANQILGTPAQLISADLLLDSFEASDLMAVMQDAAGAFGMVWRADDQGSSFVTTRRISLGLATSGVRAAMLDTDQRTDLIYAVPSSATQPRPALAIAHHDLGQGDDFDPPVDESLPADIEQIESLQVARIDADALDDVVVVGHTASSRVVLVLLTRPAAPNAGQAVLSVRQRFDIPEFAADTEVLLGDLDSDGDHDLLLASPIAGLWIVPCGDDVEGRGSGRYFVPVNAAPADWPHLFATIGFNLTATQDVDEDGLNDLVWVIDSSALGIGVGLRLVRGTGHLLDLTLEPHRQLPLDSANLLVVADINADGHMDVLVNTLSPPRRALLMGGDGSGRFADPLLLRTDMGSVGMAVADLNIDGVADVGFLGTTTGEDHFLQVHMSTGLSQ
ncbi:MAG: VCBS repeat-containing protein [Pseudomonadota bacterium]